MAKQAILPVNVVNLPYLQQADRDIMGTMETVNITFRVIVIHLVKALSFVSFIFSCSQISLTTHTVASSCLHVYPVSYNARSFSSVPLNEKFNELISMKDSASTCPEQARLRVVL